MERRFLVWVSAVLSTMLLVGVGWRLSRTTNDRERSGSAVSAAPRAASSESTRFDIEVVEGLLASIHDRLDQLVERQAHQEERIANLEAAPVASMSDRGSQQEGSGKTSRADDDEPMPVSLEEEDQEARRRFEALETRVLEESADPDWRDFAEFRIADAFAGEELESSYLESVDCRATLCRASVFHDDEIAMERFLMVFPARVGWDWDGSIELRLEGGDLETVLVLTREGSPLHLE